MNLIPHSRPTLGPLEAEAVKAVIVSGRIAQGEMTAQLEQAFSETFGLGRVAAVSSGTAALHLALLALEVGPGDEVIIPSFVCSALLNAVHYTGASPVPADIDPATGNIDPADVARRITPQTRAVIVPHLFGLAADLDKLSRLDIPLIEDCAQAVGGRYRGRALGAFGRLSVFSFYATKVMTTGEGGLVASSDPELIERVRDLREYDNRTDYSLRYNYKMSDIQAALGLVQLRRLDSFIRRRQEIADRYSAALSGRAVVLPPAAPGRIYFRYVVRVPDDAGPWIEDLARRGISCARPVFEPLHRCLNLSGYDHSDRAWRSFLSIPIYPSLTDDEAERIIAALSDRLEEANS